jgi:hypothetical protein
VGLATRKLGTLYGVFQRAALVVEDGAEVGHEPLRGVHAVPRLHHEVGDLEHGTPSRLGHEKAFHRDALSAFLKTEIRERVLSMRRSARPDASKTTFTPVHAVHRDIDDALLEHARDRAERRDVAIARDFGRDDRADACQRRASEKPGHDFDVLAAHLVPGVADDPLKILRLLRYGRAAAGPIDGMSFNQPFIAGVIDEDAKGLLRERQRVPAVMIEQRPSAARHGDCLLPAGRGVLR